MMLAVTPAFALLIALRTPLRVLFELLMVTLTGVLLPVGAGKRHGDDCSNDISSKDTWSIKGIS